MTHYAFGGQAQKPAIKDRQVHDLQLRQGALPHVNWQIHRLGHHIDCGNPPEPGRMYQIGFSDDPDKRRVDRDERQ